MGPPGGVGLYPATRRTSSERWKSIWKYNWAPDIAPQNKEHPPQRWFAYPGEAGLFTCTWPKSKHLGPNSVLYRDEIWTGIEYQVAGHMAWEGMITEALAICRAVHERYHPAKHNPWNEIECGDHYARGMASWGVLTALVGIRVPRSEATHRLRAASAPAGISQRLHRRTRRGGTSTSNGPADAQTNRIEVQWGELPLTTLAFELPAGRKLRECRVTIGQQQVTSTTDQTGNRVVITLAEPCRISRGGSIVVELQA